MQRNDLFSYLVTAWITLTAISGCAVKTEAPATQPVEKPAENVSTNIAQTACNINYLAATDLPRFNKLIGAFDKMITDGLHQGAQLAVYKNGEPILIIAGGKDVRSGSPINEKSLFSIRSTTKALAALSMAILYERGLFKYDDPVVKYWPEFGRNAKESITIAHMMSHSAGIPQAPQVPITSWTNREAVARAIEGLKPIWVPGTKFGYHATTSGWVVDELAQRLARVNIADLLQKELTGPLGIRDVYLGLPDSEYARFCTMEVLGKTAANRVALSEFLNTSQGLKLPLAWGAGVATAQDLARLFNILAFEGTYGGRTFISGNTQALISKPLNPLGSEDVILHWPVRWGLGFINGETPSIYGTVSHPQAIGHAGGGANVAWADPQQHLSVAFLCNGMRTEGEEWERYRILGDLIYEAVSSMNN